MIYAPSITDTYGSDSFPSLTDAIFEYKKDQTQENIEKIKFSLSVITYTLHSAISILKDPFDFKRAGN